jgi:eukaryotic-like serine/threonine-protein kinase
VTGRPAWLSRWPEADPIFDRALDLDPTERDAFLGRSCRGDAELRRVVEELLRWAQEDDPLLGRGALGGLLGAELLGSPMQGDPIGEDLLGSWHLVRRIERRGEVVSWLAESTSAGPARAVRITTLGALPGAGRAVRQLEQIREALASLGHPRIAALVGSGLTPRGEPWLAIEHRGGEPVVAYCDDRSSSVGERLELFLLLAEIVEAAHGVSVIHGHLEPQNVVIDREGLPALLGFGIAPTLAAACLGEPSGGVHRLLTLTREHTSPEQARGVPFGKSGDVYQLGLLLYELLSGRSAQPRCSPSELLRVACRQVPPPPSGAVIRSMAPQAIARARGATPDRLRRRLEGDLDAIVLRCLRKNPEERYATVGELADEVRRHLRDEPVRAHTGSVAYRLGKALRRFARGALAGWRHRRGPGSEEPAPPAPAGSRREHHEEASPVVLGVGDDVVAPTHDVVQHRFGKSL